MFSCTQTSQRPTIQNIINNYAGGTGTGTGGGGTGNVDLTAIYNQLSSLQISVNSLQSGLNLLELSLNNLVIDNNGVPYLIFNDLSNNYYIFNKTFNNYFTLSNNYIQPQYDISLSNDLSILFNDLCNNFIKLNAPPDISQSYTLTLPLYNQDNSGNFLKVDGSGNLYFSNVNIDLNGISFENIETQEILNDKNYIKNIYNDISFINNLSLTNSINLLKKNEGIIINYYQPYNLFNSSRDSSKLYNNIDIYEIDFFINTLKFINEKNMILNNKFNNKIYKNNNYIDMVNNIIDSYINNIYRGAFGSKINIYSNYNYVKAIDYVIYNNSLSNNNSVKKYLQFINNNHPNKDILFNEIPKMTHYGMTPPYYFELSGNMGSIIDNSCSIYFNNNVSLNNIPLNLLNFGGIEYEQNIMLLKHIYNQTSSNNNIVFYFYEQNNYSEFINLFSHDLLSIITNHIENHNNFKDFVLDNSNIITYDYGNLLFLLDNSDCNISANPNNIALKTANNILPLLNIDNIYIPNFSDLSNNYSNFDNFVNNVNNISNNSSTLNNIASTINDFSDIKLYNLKDLSNSKIIQYSTILQNISINQNNTLILCPLPKNNYNVIYNNINGNYNYSQDVNFNNELYKYSSLLQTLYKNNAINDNNTNFSTIISSNNSNLSNLICFDSSINYLYAEKNLYLTFYDLPNYINNTNNVSLFSNFNNTSANNRKFQNGRNNNYTKIIYPYYYDSSDNLLFIENFINNNNNNNNNKSYNNINNIKNIIYKGYIQIIILYIIIYLYEKFFKTTNFCKNELMNFYNYIINDNLNEFYNINSDLSNSIIDLSNSIFLINNLFNQTIYSDSYNYNYNLYKNNILLQNSNNLLDNELKNLIFNKELLLALSSKNIKLNNINSNNHNSYYTLYNINKITSSNINENNYNINISDFSNNFLDNNLRYYLLNNWKQYFPNVENFLTF